MGLICWGIAGAVGLYGCMRKDEFQETKLSPKGRYYATTVPLEDRTVLAILSGVDNKVTGHFATDRNAHVEDF